jgi:hypothetical protein
MWRWCLYLLVGLLALALAAPALAQPEGGGEGPPPVAGEAELTAGVRSGHLKRDELIAQGRKLSYFEKLRLYYYAQELEPYFLGVEEAIRDLARTPPAQAEAIVARRAALYKALETSWGRLKAAHRPGPEVEWRRGLTGLIYLDYDWRDRVAEEGKDEIKNPYDLVALLDCLDARLRGLESGSIDQCPATAPPAAPGAPEKSKQP